MEELVQLCNTIGIDDLVTLKKTLHNVVRRGNDLILDNVDPVYVLRFFSDLSPARRAGANGTRRLDFKRAAKMRKA